MTTQNFDHDQTTLDFNRNQLMNTPSLSRSFAMNRCRTLGNRSLLMLLLASILATAQTASAVQIGPGSDITEVINQDTPGANRLNVDRTFTSLPAGTFTVSNWMLNVFDNTEGGTITPMLLSGSPTNYTVVWLGEAFDPTSNGIQTVNEGSNFSLLSPTDLYAGFFTEGNGSGIIALDADNSGSGTSSTDHDSAFTAPTLIGQTVTDFSNAGLGRTYAFAINASLAVPEPSTALLLVMGLVGFVARRRRSANAVALLACFACLGIAGSAQAVTITGGGFEAPNFTNSVGYANTNGGVITGWTISDTSRVGLNPAASSPFANNGTIPEGSQVAFIQSNAGTGTLSQTLTGLVAGETYTVRYRYNARNGQTPRVDVKVNGATLQDTVINSVGGSNQYYQGSRTFKATGTSATLAFANTQTAGDSTALFDDVQVELTRQAKGWTVNNWTGDADSGINAGRVYTHALNWNGSNVNVNGVDFTGTAGANPSGANYSWTGLPNVIGGDDANNITGNSAELARRFNFGTDNTTESLTLTGLTPGQLYEANFFGVMWDVAQPANRMSHWTADGQTVTFNESENGVDNGIRLSYIYEATGATMQFDILDIVDATWHQYAFTNNEFVAVPEPSTALMLGIGIVGLCTRRRRTEGKTAALGIAIATVLGISTSAQAALVAYWPFDEGTGSTATDTISGNVGTFSGGGITYNTTVPPQLGTGSSVSFSSANNEIIVPDSPSVSVTSDMTITAWVNPETSTSARNILAKDGNGAYRYRLESTDVQWMLFNDGGGFQVITGAGPTAVTNNAWNHIAMTTDFAAGELRFYLNGSLVDTQVVSEPSIADGAGNLIIGNFAIGNTESYRGLMDDLAIFDEALAPWQIAALANGLAPTGLIPEPSTAVMLVIGLVGLCVRRRRS